EEVSAIVFEPIQGEGGYIVPPDNFLAGLRKLANKHGILLVADEVQSGMGRTGRWFAVEHWGVVPDVMCIAKGVASGMPLGVIVGRKELMTLEPGSHATTFGGNPVSLAAAEATIEVIREERLVENAEKVGRMMLKRLKEEQERIEIIGDVRGKGLMIGVELVKSRSSKEPAVKELRAVIEGCFKRGLLVIGAGVSTIRIAPPLSIPYELAEKGLELLLEVLRDVYREVKALA
ncbi:TPA: aminotransferase class III-fold pyridoxal phosphate-dependent enzyme, partial [Candidatus Micrarchaeota archaeon]|nr:aminotransferase class III-fold pyridoxal phosphate-dependent enzyme [Candidatus Micrarchaeota archaeon]